MADIAGSFMRGYGFVDNIQRNNRQEKRLDLDRARQEEMYADAKRRQSKADTESAGFQEGLISLLQSSGLKGVDQVANNPQALEKFNSLASDPISAAEAVAAWDTLKNESLDQGKLPPSGLVLDFLNNPNVGGRELEKRFNVNNLQGKLSGVYPSPDKQSVFFEGTFTDKNGKTYKAPLTSGKTIAGAPGSETDTVQGFPISKLLEYGQGAYDTNTAALLLIAKKGGTAGAQFAANFLNEQNQAKRKAMIEEYKYLRERRDKKEDDTQKRKWEKEDLATKHRYAMAEKAPLGYDLVKGEDGEIYTMNKGTGAVTPYSGGSRAGQAASGGLKGYITTSTGQVFKQKEAKELFKNLPNTFLAKASGSDEMMALFAQSGDNIDEMPIATKKSIVAAAEEVALNPEATERERSMAKLWLDIGEGLGVFPRQIAEATAHGTGQGDIAGQEQPAVAGGVDPNRFAEELALIKQGKPQQNIQAQDMAASHSLPKQSPPQGGIARSIGRALAGPGGPSSNSIGLETVAKGLSGAAKMATPAMVQMVQGIPESTKMMLMQRVAIEKWTVDQLAQAIRDIQAGYQEQSNR